MSPIQSKLSNLNPNKRLWILKTVSDSEKSYQTIESYKDDIDCSYNYDSNVPNSKRIQRGDFAILANKQDVLGFCIIQEINTDSHTKMISKCPTCGTSTMTLRKKLFPKYKCNKGHTFEHPETKTTQVKRYFAKYPALIPPNEKSNINVRSLRQYYIKYNQNLSIQALSMEALKFFPEKLKNVQIFDFILSPDSADGNEGNTEEKDFNLNNQDERKAIVGQIKARRGQKKFRDKLRKRYGDICMITNCTVLDILEAAHIKPYRNADDNHPSNGLLLRSDIHTLFDLNLIGIDPNTLKVHISNKLKGTEYESLKNRLLAVSQNKPNKACLDIRWDEFKN